MSKPLSREFLLSRKKCCQNGCQNCPYKTMYVPLPFNFNLKIPTHKEGLEDTKKLIKNMEEKEKYYIPDREDFREGFEYEQLHCSYSPPDFKLTSSDWVKQIFDDFTSEENYLFNRYFQSNSIRVPFLTKEQIITEGWNLTKEPSEEEFTCQKIISDKYFYEVDYDSFLKELTVEKFYQSRLGGNPGIYDSYTIFKGSIRCINDFRG